MGRESGLAGVAAWLFNVAAMAAVVLALLRVDPLPDWGLDATDCYSILLTAACPRCALVSGTVCSREPPGGLGPQGCFGWQPGHPSLASHGVFQSLHSVRRITSEAIAGEDAAMWFLAPSLQVVIGSAPSWSEWRGQRLSDHAWQVLLAILQVAAAVHDKLCLALCATRAGSRAGGSALAVAVSWALRHFLLWGLMLAIYWVSLLSFFHGAEAFILMLGLGFILLIRIVEVVRGVHALLEHVRELHIQAVSKYRYTSQGKSLLNADELVVLFGLVFAIPACAIGAFLGPFGPLIMLGWNASFGITPILSYVVTAWCMALFVPGCKLLGNAIFIAALLDQGAANLLQLETLRHTTSFLGYFSIQLTGGRTSAAGASTGGMAAAGMSGDKDTRMLFLFKDTFSGHDWELSWASLARLDVPITDYFRMDHLATTWTRLTQPNFHSFLSAREAFVHLLSGRSVQDCWDTWGGFAAPLIWLADAWGTFVLMLPSLKFRFCMQDMMTQQLKDDKQYGGLCWYSYYDVPAWRLGVAGSVLAWLTGQGMCKELTLAPARAVGKLLTGVTQLLIAAAWLRLVDPRQSGLALALLAWL